MNTLRQYFFLFFLILFGTSTPHVWAQQPPAKIAKTNYSYKVIAKIPAHQNIVLDGTTIASVGVPHLTDSGDVIFEATTADSSKSCALFKNQHVLVFNGKPIPGGFVTTGPYGNGIYTISVTQSGDVYYSALHKANKGDKYDATGTFALFLNDSVLSDNSDQYKGLIPPNTDSPRDPIKPTGIYIDELYKQIFGIRPDDPQIKNHSDAADQANAPSCPQVKVTHNHKGQLAILLTPDPRWLTAAERQNPAEGQVLLVATPTNAPGPEPDVLFSDVLTDKFLQDAKPK